MLTAMLIAQISDFHVVPSDTESGKLMQTERYLRAAVAHIESLTPKVDAILASGDLVDAGSAREYELLADITDSFTAPLYMVPGNHDDRDVMRAVMTPRGHSYWPAEGFAHFALDLGGLRLVALDTLVPGEPGGLLCDQRLAWLDKTLSESDAPTIVMQHHPPFATGMSQMDGMGLRGATEEELILRRHDNVERVVCGHLHRSITRRFAGTIASTAPSTAHAVELDLHETGRLAVVAEPPACVLHLWRNGSLVSHLSYIGDYGAPHVISA